MDKTLIPWRSWTFPPTIAIEPMKSDEKDRQYMTRSICAYVYIDRFYIYIEPMYIYCHSYSYIAFYILKKIYTYINESNRFPSWHIRSITSHRKGLLSCYRLMLSSTLHPIISRLHFKRRTVWKERKRIRWLPGTKFEIDIIDIHQTFPGSHKMLKSFSPFPKISKPVFIGSMLLRTGPC